MPWKILFASLCLFVAPGNALAQQTASARAWRDLAVADVDALYRSVRDLHPGYRDPETPDFAYDVETSYRNSRMRAQRAASYPDWRAATQSFMLSFRDGHTIYLLNAVPDRVRWPGFLLDARQDGSYFVRTPPGLPAPDAQAEGSRMLSCDGIAIEALLQRSLDGIEADWSKPSERIRNAFRLLIDYDLASDPPIRECMVAGATGSATLTLSWRNEFWSELQPRLAVFNRELSRPTELRVTADGARWFSLGDFGDEAKLEAVAADTEAQIQGLRAAPYIVFDLRGNRGGNSGWGRRFAALVYGEGALALREAEYAAQFPPRSGKFWRASPQAAAAARAAATRFASRGPALADVARYWNGVAELMERAPEGDRALVEDPCCSDPVTEPATGEAVPAYERPVYVLIDAGCFSSCILALDPLRAMGAIFVGEMTGENEEYGEIAGPLTTPSGLARYYVPISIIRQRPEMLSVRPDRAWSGSMDDDAGIAAWIAEMAAQPR